MCLRCGGVLNSETEEPTCLTCGWVDYGTPAEIAVRQAVSNKKLRLEGTGSDARPAAKGPQEQDWAYPYRWRHPSRSGVIWLKFIVHNSTRAKYALATDIRGLPNRYSRDRVAKDLRAAFKLERGMTLRDVEDCLDADGTASWATKEE